MLQITTLKFVYICVLVSFCIRIDILLSYVAALFVTNISELWCRC